MTRREAMAAAASAAAVAGLPARALGQSGTADAALRRLLDGFKPGEASLANLRVLEAFDPAGLSAVARADREAVLHGLGIDLKLAARFPFGLVGRSPYVVSPTAGAWREAGSVPLPAGLAERIDEETGRIADDAAEGVILPRPLLEKTIGSLQAAAGKAEPAVASALGRQCAQLVSLRRRSVDAPGVWRFKNGEEYYALMLARQFGALASPRETHEKALAKMRELMSRADRLLRKRGLSSGSVGERYRSLMRNPAAQFSADDAGRDRAVAEMNRWVERMKPRLDRFFDAVPPSARRVSVKRMSRSDEASKRQGYRQPPSAEADGAYFVDLADIARRPAWTLPSVVHHELLPGHMIQIPYEAEANPHPLRLFYSPAFSEGWAVYAEQMAAEDGAFEGDDLAELGYLHWLLFRIGRSAIDTGVHLMRWSAVEALQTLEMIQGEPVIFAPFGQDIERICLAPATRAAEALTWLRIVDLRAGLAAEKIGSPQMRRFHGELLRLGAMPFALLESRLTTSPRKTGR